MGGGSPRSGTSKAPSRTSHTVPALSAISKANVPLARRANGSNPVTTMRPPLRAQKTSDRAIESPPLSIIMDRPTSPDTLALPSAPGADTA